MREYRANSMWLRPISVVNRAYEIFRRRCLVGGAGRAHLPGVRAIAPVAESYMPSNHRPGEPALRWLLLALTVVAGLGFGAIARAGEVAIGASPDDHAGPGAVAPADLALAHRAARAVLPTGGDDEGVQSLATALLPPEAAPTTFREPTSPASVAVLHRHGHDPPAV